MIIKDIDRFQSAWGVNPDSISLLSDVTLPLHPALTLRGLGDEEGEPVTLNNLGDNVLNYDLSGLSWQSWALAIAGAWYFLGKAKSTAKAAGERAGKGKARLKQRIKEAG